MAQNSSSLNQIAYNLLNTMRGGESSNTESVSLEQIKFNIKYYRATFIRRDAYRNNDRLRQFEQDLGIVSLSTVDTAEDDNVSSGVKVRKTPVLPAPVRLKNSEAITHVSCKDKFGQQIPVIDAQRAHWEQFSKYSNKMVFATLLNGALYVFNDITIDNINVRGVFEDPEEVHDFTRANGLDLYDADSPFPISTDMLEGITKGLLNGEMKLIAQTPTDTTTDTLQGQ